MRHSLRRVISVGRASLFSDSSHEMVASLLPGFVASTLHSGPAALGVIDGVADMMTGLGKLAGGPLAADPRRRARLASGGYLGTAVTTSLIALATVVAGALWSAFGATTAFGYAAAWMLLSVVLGPISGLKIQTPVEAR